jgi:acetolactate synthase-1/2/3 large subunit
VALLVPYDVLDAKWRPGHADTEVDDRHRRAPAYRPVAARDDVERAATLLERAQRPLIVAGGGVHASRATAELTAVAEWLDAMVVTSFSGKGAVAETAPYAAGVPNPLGTKRRWSWPAART